MVAFLCRGDDGFEILDRPALSLLKIRGVPTKDGQGCPLDLEQVLLELFDDPCLEGATFWHTPRFVTYKGAPPGRLGTLFFSLVDSSDFALGKSLLNTAVHLFGQSFQIQWWHSRGHLSLPPMAIYKEGLALESLPFIHNSSSAALVPSPSAALHEGGAFRSPPSPATDTDNSVVSTASGSPALTDDLVVPATSYPPTLIGCPAHQELYDLFSNLNAQWPDMLSLQDYLNCNKQLLQHGTDSYIMNT